MKGIESYFLVYEEIATRNQTIANTHVLEGQWLSSFA